VENIPLETVDDSTETGGTQLEIVETMNESTVISSLLRQKQGIVPHETVDYST